MPQEFDDVWKKRNLYNLRPYAINRVSSLEEGEAVQHAWDAVARRLAPPAGGHGRVECSCGTVLWQCRCPGLQSVERRWKACRVCTGEDARPTHTPGNAGVVQETPPDSY